MHLCHTKVWKLYRKICTYECIEGLFTWYNPRHEDNPSSSGVHEFMRNHQATVTFLKTGKWGTARILKEARTRTKELFNPKAVATMLQGLLEEAGWTEDEFMDALCQDVIKKGQR